MINALFLGIRKALFILLEFFKNNTKAINISGDIKASMFVYELH